MLCLSQVAAFCDVDENKNRKGFYCYEGSQVQAPLHPRPGVTHTTPGPLLGAIPGLLSRHYPEPSSWGKAI